MGAMHSAPLAFHWYGYFVADLYWFDYEITVDKAARPLEQNAGLIPNRSRADAQCPLMMATKNFRADAGL